MIDGPRALLDAVEQTGADTPVWTFLGRDPPAGGSGADCVTAVHRADAALALDVPFDIDPGTAADGMTEYLERGGPGRGTGRPASPAEGPVAASPRHRPGLGAAGEWTIAGHPDGITVGNKARQATAALRGPGMLLAIVRRGTLRNWDWRFSARRYGTPGWPERPSDM